MIFIRAFEPDEDYDHSHASDGESRYGFYLARCAYRFIDENDGRPTTDPALFAAAAWQVANIQTMAPGYVRAHGRVQQTEVQWDYECNPAVCVALATSSAPEAAGFTFPWRRWTRDERGQWVGPLDFSRPTAVTTLRVEVPLAGASLPEPRYVEGQPGRPDTETAKQAVRIICRLLNASLAPVLAHDPLAGASDDHATQG